MPKRKYNQLTSAGVRALTAEDAGTHTDGDTLTLRVEKTGSKRWVQRITIDGTQRNMGLGGYPTIGLADARKKARLNVLVVQEGRNPIDEKRKARREAIERAGVMTFWEIAQEVIEKNSEGWTDPKAKTDWTNTLLRYAVPVIGNKRPRDIMASDIQKMLLPIWINKKDTANKVLHRVRATFEYAITMKWCEANPADQRILTILPKRRRGEDKHFRSMPQADLPAALVAIKESIADHSSKLAIEFLALTAARSGEVRKATWSEINLASRTWTVPATRMKARKEHRVPLTDRAVEILEEAAPLTHDCDLVFPNTRIMRPYSDSTFSKLFRELEIPAVPHGMRSCFKNWTRDDLPNPDHVMAEIALAHEVGSAMEKVYGTSDMFEKRRVMMQEWADFLARGTERTATDVHGIDLKNKGAGIAGAPPSGPVAGQTRLSVHRR